MDVRSPPSSSTRSVEQQKTNISSTRSTGCSATYKLSDDDITPPDQRRTHSESMDSSHGSNNSLVEQQQQQQQQQQLVVASDHDHASSSSTLEQQQVTTSIITDQELDGYYDEWEAMDAQALDFEQEQEYDQALACYERVLLARSHYLGQHHIDVAKSLINAGRVMELQGNCEGSLDLYRVAHAIYSGKVTSDEFRVGHRDAETIMELVPKWMEQGRYEEAVAFLIKCLEIADGNMGGGDESGKDNDSRNDRPDKSCAHIHLALGRAYLGLRDYTAATVCLVEAAKNDGDEEEIYGLLQRVEFMQRQTAEARAENSWGSGEYGSASNSDSNQRTATSARSRCVPNAEPSAAVATANIESTAAVTADESPPSMKSGYYPDEEKRPDPSRFDPPQLRGSVDSLSAFGSEFSDEESVADLAHVLIDPIPDKTKKLAGSIPLQKKALPGTGEKVVATTESLDEDVFRFTSPASSKHTSSIPQAPAVAVASPTASAQDSSIKAAGGSRSSRVLRIPSPRRKKNQGTEWSLGSPSSRKNKNQSTEGSLGSKKKNQAADRSTIARTISDQFRRPRRGGFASLTEEKYENPESLSSASEIDIGNESSFDGPVQFISMGTGSWDENISQITMVLDDPHPSRASNNGNGWWWGVSAEGFGRWFPTHLVSPAVEAAEGFLSANAIHSKARPPPLDFGSDGNLNEEKESDRNETNLSHLDISTKLNITNIAVSPDGEEIEYIAGEVPTSQRPKHFVLSPTSRTQYSENDKVDLTSDIANLDGLVTIQQRELGTSHIEVARTLFNLAVLHRRSDSVVLATESAVEALRIQKAAGKLTDAIKSLHFLAGVQLQQKQYKAALTYYTECLRMERTVFGYHSEETAKTLNFIGTVHANENEFSLAMQSHQEALQILQECHGENLKHPLVSETLCQIGAVYYRERNSPATMTTKTGDYDTFIEAGMLDIIGRAHEDRGSFKMAISFFEEKLQFLKNRDEEAETPAEVSATLNSLAMLSTRVGLFSEAIEYYDSALSIQKELGCDEIYVATSEVLKGTVEFQMGNWRKALKILVDGHAVLVDELGGEHQTVAGTLYQIGVVQNALCEVDEAISALEEAKSIQINLLGKDHPATLRTRRQISDMFAVYEAELDSSLAEFNDILTTQLRIHGEKHPNIAETLHSIGCAQSRKGDSSKALRTLEECYYMRLAFLGWDHPLQGSTLHEIVLIHLKAGRLKKALHISEVVLGIRKEALGEGHIDVARTLTTKGSCLVAQGKFVAATECFREALRISEAAVGDTHPSVADVYSEMGSMHLRQCQFDEARCDIEKAKEMYRLCSLEEDHPGIRDALAKLERVDHDEMLYV